MADAYNKSDLEILVSTMNRNSLDFLLPMFPFSHFSGFNILIVNQTTSDKLLNSDYPSVRIVNTFEKGLSKSRNTALDNAKGDLCIISDDDIVFHQDFERNAVDAYNIYPDAALITFRIERDATILYKKYPQRPNVKPNVFDRLNVMSVEMVLNRRKLKQNSIKFNENFGLGAKFRMGEEAIFTNALHADNLKMVMVPYILGRHSDDSTHTKVSLREKYFVQGAVLSAIFNKRYLYWVLIKLAFDLKQSKVDLGQVPSMFRAAISGRREFLRLSALKNNIQAS